MMSTGEERATQIITLAERVWHMLYAILSKQRDSEQCQCHIIVNNATRHDTDVVSLTNEVGQCNVVSEDDIKLE